MNKLCILAALLTATTAAHAGNSVSFEIEGHRIHIEAPKNCDSLSCIRISAPGLTGSAFNLKGFKGFNSDDDDAADNSTAPKTAPAPAVQATAPAAPAPAPVANSTPAAAATMASTTAAPIAKRSSVSSARRVRGAAVVSARITRAAAVHPVSRQWKGYWQKRRAAA